MESSFSVFFRIAIENIDFDTFILLCVSPQTVSFILSNTRTLVLDHTNYHIIPHWV